MSLIVGVSKILTCQSNKRIAYTPRYYISLQINKIKSKNLLDISIVIYLYTCFDWYVFTISILNFKFQFLLQFKGIIVYIKYTWWEQLSCVTFLDFQEHLAYLLLGLSVSYPDIFLYRWIGIQVKHLAQIF